MIFSPFPFLVFAIVAVIVTNVTKRGLGHTALYLIINILFLALFLGRLEAALLIAFTLWGYLMLRGIERWSTGIFGILSTLAIFVFLKRYRFLPAGVRLDSIPAILGLSYVLFRVLHLIVDTYQARSEAPPLARYLNYTLSCFSLVSGPFQRFGDHEASISAPRTRDSLTALSRICNGLLKTLILAPAVLDSQTLLRFYSQSRVTAGPPLAFAEVVNHFSARIDVLSNSADGMFVLCSIVGALVWIIFLYLNFSGYMDVVIGWASLCRLDLPENFNSPIRADSLLDFWNRWHMSTTNWFKTYLFTPTLKALTVRWPHRRSALFNTAAAFVVTFLFMGLWHGPDWPFAVCGLLLAFGAALNHTYRELLRRRLGSRRAADLGERMWYRVLAAGFTFTYLAVVIAPFWMANADYLRLLRDLAGPNIGIFVFFSVVTGIAGVAIRFVADSIKRLWVDVKLRGFAPISFSASIAIRLNILLLGILVNYHGMPEFVYKGF